MRNRPPRFTPEQQAVLDEEHARLRQFEGFTWGAVVRAKYLGDFEETIRLIGDMHAARTRFNTMADRFRE